MAGNYYQYDSKTTNSWISPLVNSKDGVDIAMLFTRRESRRTSDSALLSVRSKELRLVPFREIDVGQASEPEGCSSLACPTL